MTSEGLGEVQRAIDDIRYAEWKIRFRKKWQRLFGVDLDEDRSIRGEVNDEKT